MLIGYARTSTIEQVAGLEAQHAALAATGCTKVFSEQASSVAQRGQLDAALDFVREGDTLIVTRLDRLARSTADLLGIVALLERKEVGLRVLDFGGSEVDTRSPTGRMLLTMFAAVAEFERSIMLGRQRAGVARARAEGKYKGRAPTARRKGKQVVALHASGVNRRSTGTPYRRATGTPSSAYVGAVVLVVHRRDPRPLPRAVTSAGGDGRGRFLWTHRVNRREGGPGGGF